MAWHNRHSNAAEIINGDKPYGSYWEEIPDQPSPFHRPTREQQPDGSWSFTGWVLDEKAAHNAPIDAEIQRLEQETPHTHRGLREGLYAIVLLADLINERLAAIEANIRTIPGHEAFDAGRLPDLKQNAGAVKIKTVDDAIRALRAQRLP